MLNRFCLRLCLAILMFGFLSARANAIDVKELRTSSGLSAWFVEDHSVPLVSIDAAFERGTVDDPTQQHGVAFLLSGLMDEGAGGLSGEMFRERMKKLGIKFTCTSFQDFYSFGFSVPIFRNPQLIACARNPSLTRSHKNAIQRLSHRECLIK
jgi:predicted Zn-dependent peptidase